MQVSPDLQDSPVLQETLSYAAQCFGGLSCLLTDRQAGESLAALQCTAHCTVHCRQYCGVWSNVLHFGAAQFSVYKVLTSMVQFCVSVCSSIQ